MRYSASNAVTRSKYAMDNVRYLPGTATIKSSLAIARHYIRQQIAAISPASAATVATCAWS